MFIFGVIAIEILHAELPVWAFLLALVIGMPELQSLLVCVLIDAI
jgi:hypothetical protein